MWHTDYLTQRTIDNFVGRLRAKFEPDPDRPRYFLTVRGVGYRFEPGDRHRHAVREGAVATPPGGRRSVGARVGAGRMPRARRRVLDADVIPPLPAPRRRRSGALQVNKQPRSALLPRAATEDRGLLTSR